MRVTTIFSVILVASFTLVEAQHPIINRYVPGHYLSDNHHRVVFYNPSNQPISLAGYLLVTRDYAEIFPSGIRISPQKSWVVAKSPAPGVDFKLDGTPDFQVRFHFLEHAGHYLALFSPAGQLVQAAYMSPSINVPFFPDRDTLIASNGVRHPIYLPPENRPFWSHVPMQNASAFVLASGKWQIESLPLNLQIGVENLTASFKQGVANVKWSVGNITSSTTFRIERSSDNLNFQSVGKEKFIVGKKNYLFNEVGVSEGQTYFYRVCQEGVNGSGPCSDEVVLRATEEKQDFLMELQPTGNGTLGIRISSKKAQRVMVKVFNGHMQEVAILFRDYVYADVPVMMAIHSGLSVGVTYTIMATTESGRYFREYRVPEINP